MLVLTRRVGESLLVGAAEVVLVSIKGNTARLGIVAPRDCPVDRQEVAVRKGRPTRSRKQSEGEPAAD